MLIPGFAGLGPAWTMTVKVSIGLFWPSMSVATHETCVTPSGNVVPETGWQATSGLGSARSVAAGAV